MPQQPPKNIPIGTIHSKIIEALKSKTQGLTMAEMQTIVDPTGQQVHFTKRVRELYKFYDIERRREGTRTLYIYRGEKEASDWRFARVSKTLRAKIIHRDGNRCQMCGRTAAVDHVVLHVDHQIPEEWGGSNSEDNLWTLCSDCNEGKKNYFASFDNQLMKQILKLPDVHSRIATLLKLNIGKWVESDLLEFVAKSIRYQEDWQKRLRELREIGFDIKSGKVHTASRVRARYMLLNNPVLPENPAAEIRKCEYAKKKKT